MQPSGSTGDTLNIDPQIPDKLYFRIGDVSKLAGVKPYVLRFWESEFPAISPKKSGTGHRLYRRKDVELVLEIKRLLYDKRFTIEGARKALMNRSEAPVSPSVSASAQKELFAPPAEELRSIRRELQAIVEMLSR